MSHIGLDKIGHAQAPLRGFRDLRLDSWNERVRRSGLRSSIQLHRWPADRGAPDRSTWTWDGKHWTERQDIGPGSRIGTAMTFDSGRKRAVLFGGGQGGVLRRDTWELSELLTQSAC